MKKITFSLLCISFLLFACVTMHANITSTEISMYRPLPISICEESLKDILIPNWTILNYKNLCREPIIARRITTYCQGNSPNKEWIHKGHYVEGCITTLVDGCSDHYIVGEQVVSIGKQISRSSDYTIETICGKKYIIHLHNGFKVYSTATEQFVMAS